MRRITPVPPPPSELADPDSIGRKEAERAQAYLQQHGTIKGFEFAAYKNPAVVKALEAAFLGKCAYCEHRYDAGAPCDVEHYRPKGGVEIDGDLTEPFYYWLAAEWTNLLPSCADC